MDRHAGRQRTGGGVFDREGVTRDFGWDSPDVHPPDKRPEGMRLAEAVLKARAR